MARTRRFDEGSLLAWAVHVGPGYRHADAVEWRVTELRGAPGPDGVSVASLVGEQLPGPEVSVRALEDGRVSFRASEPLVVQVHGEERPRSGGPLAEVPYGSVVRAGPLLLAPLYGEQLESVREGRMALPEVPLVAARHDARDDGGDDDLAAAMAARRRVTSRWAAAWALSFVAAPLPAYLTAHASTYGFWPLDVSEGRVRAVIAMLVGHWLGTFFVGLPVQVAMGRWKRTPGASEELAPWSGEGRSAATIAAVASAAATLLILPWLLGLGFLALLRFANLSVGSYDRFAWLGLSTYLGVVLSIVFCIFACMWSGPLQRAVVWWLSAAPAVRRG